MSDCLVSFGVPLYNEAKNIGILMTSILNQTYKNIEVLIVNNGSTDNTLERLNKYISDDPRVSLVDLPKNRGSSWSFKHLVSIASGDYFAWIPGDVELWPNFTDVLLRELDNDEQLVSAYSAVSLIGPEKISIDSFSLMQDSPIDRIKSLYQNLHLGTMVNGLHRMEIMKSLFVSPPSGFMPIWSAARQFNFGDLQFLTFLLLEGKIKQIKVPLVRRDFKNNNKLKYHVQILARNETYFCHQYCNIGLPSYTGIHEIILRLFQSNLGASEFVTLKDFIINILTSKFEAVLNNEVKVLLEVLINKDFTAAWSNHYSNQNKQRSIVEPKLIEQFLHEINADIQIAKIYSKGEDLVVIDELCELFIREFR